MDKIVWGGVGGTHLRDGCYLGRLLQRERHCLFRTSLNELKMSTEKVQVKHWRRGDKNMKKILEG